MKKTGITVVIASSNVGKIQAAQNAFYAVFPHGVHDFISFAAPSGVSVQPKSEYETYRGALNRLAASKEIHPNADYHIAIESGVIDLPGSMTEIGSIIVAEKGYERIFHTEIPRFEMPTEIARFVRSGMELGPANDLFFKKENSKQEGGMVGEVTDQVVTRISIMSMAATIGFSQLKNKHLYPARS